MSSRSISRRASSSRRNEGKTSTVITRSRMCCSIHRFDTSSWSRRSALAGLPTSPGSAVSPGSPALEPRSPNSEPYSEPLGDESRERPERPERPERYERSEPTSEPLSFSGASKAEPSPAMSGSCGRSASGENLAPLTSRSPLPPPTEDMRSAENAEAGAPPAAAAVAPRPCSLTSIEAIVKEAARLLCSSGTAVVARPMSIEADRDLPRRKGCEGGATPAAAPSAGLENPCRALSSARSTPLAALESLAPGAERWTSSMAERRMPTLLATSQLEPSSSSLSSSSLSGS